MSVCWEFGVPCYFLFLLMLVFRCWEQILKQENGEPRQPSSRTHLINRERVRCQRFGAAARREEGEYPATSTELEHALRSQAFPKAYFVDQVMSSFEVAGSLSDEQRGRGGKDRQPFGLSSGERLAALLLSHRTLWLCFFVAPCQSPARA